MTSLVRIFAGCAVALSLFWGAAVAQPQPEKPKAAVYIKGNPQGRDVLRMAVNTFLVKTGRYQMIAVDAIDLIAQEHKRQMGGAVSDDEIAKIGRDAGARYVCVVERSEMDGVSYVTTSMVNVQSKIAEFSDMKELPYGERVINIIERQINAMLGISSGEEPPQRSPLSEPVEQRPLSAEPNLRVNNQDGEVGVSFGASGGTRTLSVYTDAGDYAVSNLPAWCTVDKSAKSFTLTCAPNPYPADRSDRFTVASENEAVTVTVVQLGSPASPRASYSSSSSSAPRLRSEKPERAPRPPKRQSVVLGGVFATDFSGGAKWEQPSGNEAGLEMPYSGFGFNISWDLAYLQFVFSGYWGGGTFEMSDGSGGDLPELSRGYRSYGAFGKFPLIGIASNMTLFPVYGIDYAEIIDTASAAIKYHGGGNEDIVFDGKSGRPSKSVFNAPWVRLGGGIDIAGGGDDQFYMRIEALYGIRLAAYGFEKDFYYKYSEYVLGTDASAANITSKPIPGRGLIIRIGFGCKI